MLLGLGRAATMEVKGTARRNAFLAVVLGVLIVTIPLALTGLRIAADAKAELQSKEVVGAWITGASFKIRGVQAADDQFGAGIAGVIALIFGIILALSWAGPGMGLLFNRVAAQR